MTAEKQPALFTLVESQADRDRWREALTEHLARRQRIAELRVELAAARLAGKQRRHQRRLAQLNGTVTTDER